MSALESACPASPNQLYIGLMSGTSMDGVDAVIIRMQDMAFQGAITHTSLAFPPVLRERLLALQTPAFNELHQSALLAQELARLYAAAVAAVLSKAGLNAADICAIGCHGQTVRHAPEYAYTLQLADWALLAELSGIDVIGDFRSRDMAAGGQGAPLVPAFHQAVFGHPEMHRVLVNLGGIANISILTPGAAPQGFDTGPANMLMDAWVREHWHKDYDEDGRLAAQGQVLPQVLERLLADAYFRQPPPKSTGRDYFNRDWLLQHLNGHENPHDVLATLLECTARSVAAAVKQHAAPNSEVLACGGGAANPILMQRLAALLAPLPLADTHRCALAPQWVEAAAFAWLAAAWKHRYPASVPEVTGAQGARLLGAAYLYR